MVKYVPTYTKGIKKTDQQRTSNDTYAMFSCVFFSDFLYKSICFWYSFELHRQVDAIQMGTQNILLYKPVDRKYTGCNLNCLTACL